MITSDLRCAHRKLEARLRPFVARRVSDPSSVDDVVQDVFLRMHRGLPNLRDDERFGPWAYQIARSAIADHRRAQARHPVPAAPSHDTAVGVADPADGIAERELADYVAPFVAMLPSPYREALTLTELEGLSQREAAELAGISLSGMKSRVQRGRERLRALIEDCCQVALDARGNIIECEPRPNGKRPGGCC
jgi:RNA polymerase sigma-70 factor, ECF subfamily